MGGHTFISYAREDAAIALRVAAGLQTRGVTVWVDLWDIQPGADWDQAIDGSLRSCASFVLVLSPDAVASDEVRGELRAALNGGKHMVPVLYRPCDIPRQLQNIQYLDIHGSTTIPEALLDRLAQVLRQGQAAPSDESGPRTRSDDLRPTLLSRSTSTAYPTRRQLRIRRDVLDDVKSETADRLTQSIQTGSPLAILIETQPGEVSRPWDADVKAAHLAPPASYTAIAEAFDDPAIAGRLLVLGEPGAGKTTALLQLAEHLIARAQLDLDKPIPVLLNLSSWTPEKGTLEDWLVHEVKVKYGVRADHVARWRDERGLAPLLDGLDELPPAQQEACVRAVNQFQQMHRPAHLVVCCRLAEYKNLSVKLQLNGAIRLLPLLDAQIHTYLERAGCSHLWESISADPASVDLARSPLMLGLMTSIDDERALTGKALSDPAGRTAQLFDAYIQKLMPQAASRGQYSPTETTRWLAGLASMLATRGQSELLIERMQPDWLQARSQRWLFRVGVALLTSAVVVSVWVLLARLTDLLPRGAIGRELSKMFTIFGHGPSETVALLAVGLTIGLVVASRGTITPIETLTWSWRTARSGARRWFGKAARAGLVYGTCAGAAFGVLAGATFLWKPVLGSPLGGVYRAGVVLGAAVGLLASVAFGQSAPRFWKRPTIPHGMTLRTANALMSAVVYGVGVGLALGWIVGMVTGVGIAIIVEFCPLVTPASCARLGDALIVGVVSALTVGVITGWSTFFPGDFVKWVGAWAQTGLNVGILAVLLIVITEVIRGKAEIDPAPEGPGVRWLRAWSLSIAIGLCSGIVLGLLAALLGWSGHASVVRGIGLAGLGLEFGFAMLLTGAVMFGLGSGLNAALAIGTLGATCGAMTGLTGPDVQRRTVPNQGIRQSAVNVAVFAVLGCLFVGLPLGVLNVLSAAVLARTLPDAADWVRLGLGSGLSFGVLAGLLPGAACIQHAILRLVLWWSGMAPMRYARFLDFATERMLLQRIGGRYRFLHVLLRDHFARGVVQVP